MTPKPSNEWLQRHNDAWSAPVGYERAIVYACRAAESYINRYNSNYCQEVNKPWDDGLATDGVLSVGISHILQGVLVLLDGEIGRLDGGMCWQEVDRLSKLAGWKDCDDMRENK